MTLTKFKLIQAFIVVLLICKNEDQFNIESTCVVTTDLPLKVYWDFSRRSMAAYSTAQGLIWPNFKPMQDFNVVLISCKNKEDPMKNESARVVTTLSID